MRWPAQVLFTWAAFVLLSAPVLAQELKARAYWPASTRRRSVFVLWPTPHK